MKGYRLYFRKCVLQCSVVSNNYSKPVNSKVSTVVYSNNLVHKHWYLGILL